MCTVSWLPRSDGYSLWFNRDERLTRAPATAPAVRERGGVTFIAPLDGDFGGTWLAVNRFGLTLGLVNRYRVPEYTPPAAPRSRGLLPLDLINAATRAEALRRLPDLPLTDTQPFTLLVAAPGSGIALAAWDGGTLGITEHEAAGLVLTSSSVTEPEVAAARQRTFAALGEPTAAALTAIHRSHLPERGRLSICMHREDAETQSFSRVAVGPDRIVFDHVPDAPCRSAALPPIVLERKPASVPSTR